MTIDLRPLPEGLARWLAEPEPGPELMLAWLGQAGFVLRVGPKIVVIDPYLSDHLAEKYRGTRFPHVRMMPSPIAPDAFPRVDLVLCTHRHTDHMDPGTLPILAARHPNCRFVVPEAELAHAEALGVPRARVIPANAGQTLQPWPDLDFVLHPVAAAHEKLECDEAGHHHFLGYGIETGGLRLYHSGDCVPYAGLDDTVRQLRPDLALLPVNGRDATRAAAGIPGNFTLEEATELCQRTGIASLLVHHFGLFDFNTADPAEIDAAVSRQAASGALPEILRADTCHAYRLHRQASPAIG